jgi:hypothetical protein
MIIVFEKKIQLYKGYLKKGGLTELGRLKLEIRRNGLYQLLRFIEHENTLNLLSSLTYRVYELEKMCLYELEKIVQALQEKHTQH